MEIIANALTNYLVEREPALSSSTIQSVLNLKDAELNESVEYSQFADSLVHEDLSTWDVEKLSQELFEGAAMLLGIYTDDSGEFSIADLLELKMYSDSLYCYQLAILATDAESFACVDSDIAGASLAMSSLITTIKLKNIIEKEALNKNKFDLDTLKYQTLKSYIRKEYTWTILEEVIKDKEKMETIWQIPHEDLIVSVGNRIDKACDALLH